MAYSGSRRSRWRVRRRRDRRYHRPFWRGVNGTDYAVQSADLKVQFLQPATIPTLDVTAGSGDAATGKLDFTMEIGPSGTTDVVTILATDVPEGAYFRRSSTMMVTQQSLRCILPVGAKAEVPGVRVLPSNVFMDSGVAQTVYLQLPGAYDRYRGQVHRVCG